MSTIYKKIVKSIINDEKEELYGINCKRGILNILVELVDYNVCINPLPADAATSKQCEMIVWMWHVFYLTMPAFQPMTLGIPIIYWIGMQVTPDTFVKTGYVYMCLVHFFLKNAKKSYKNEELVNLFAVIKKEVNIKYNDELVLCKMSNFTNLFINFFKYMVCFLHVF